MLSSLSVDDDDEANMDGDGDGKSRLERLKCRAEASPNFRFDSRPDPLLGAVAPGNPESEHIHRGKLDTRYLIVGPTRAIPTVGI